ncbi:hypothetical protein FMN50_08780 [Rhodobacterales bacterium]|nr:hypothetical protein FMN50_08780 [Rhodobacterales bacterium]
MPFKFHASRRLKFAKSKHRVTNWSEYTKSLRRRADITVWLDKSVMHQWGMARTRKRGLPGGYSDLAITVCLEIRTVFHLPPSTNPRVSSLKAYIGERPA